MIKRVVIRGNSFSSGPCAISNGPMQLVWDNVTDPGFDPLLRYG